MEELRKLNLQEMCPEKLRDIICACGPSRFPDYEDLKTGIVDWLGYEISVLVSSGAELSALGVLASDGVVLAAEKRITSKVRRV